MGTIILFSCTGSTQIPSLQGALANAEFEGTPLAWCAGKLLLGDAEAFAVAARSADADGGYFVIASTGETRDLATFTGSPELACYTMSEAVSLHETISSSEAIDGSIEPIWSTDVVCGFVDDVEAICWQYSPAERGFVRVGGWINMTISNALPFSTHRNSPESQHACRKPDQCRQLIYLAG